MTAEERLEVMAKWDTLPGNTHFFYAVQTIADGA
jgi:hypothetical protein